MAQYLDGNTIAASWPCYKTGIIHPYQDMTVRNWTSVSTLSCNKKVYQMHATYINFQVCFTDKTKNLQ